MKTTCQVCKGTSFRKLFTKKGFDILCCTDCGLVFTDIPPGVNLLGIYNETYFEGGMEDGYADYASSEKVLRTEFRKTVELIRRLTNHRTDLKLLEVGSAYGFFLDEATPFFSCSGIEVSEAGVQFSRKRGNHVVHGVVEEKTMNDLGTFDVIVMLDVIEHLPSPHETVSRLGRHLNNDGILLIVTGDINSLLARVMRRSWRLMTPPQHTFFFSGSTLTRMLQQAGLSVVKISRPWKFVPLGLALHQVTARLGMKWSGGDWLHTVGLYVNLFDTVRIIARK